MKKCLSLICFTFVICTGGVWSQDAPAPYPLTINSRAQTAPPVLIYRANEVRFRVTFTDGGTTSTVSATDIPFLNWMTNANATANSTSSWSLVAGVTGQVDFVFSPASVNYEAGRYAYECGIKTSTGTPRTYRQGIFQIQGSPVGAGVGAVNWTTNINWAVHTYSGTTDYGPYRAGDGITITTNADGSVTWTPDGTIPDLTYLLATQALHTAQIIASSNAVIAAGYAVKADTNDFTQIQDFSAGLTSPFVRADSSGGFQIQAMNSYTCAVFGVGGSQATVFNDGVTVSGLLNGQNASFGGQVYGQEPSETNSLTTKAYVDDQLSDTFADALHINGDNAMTGILNMNSNVVINSAGYNLVPVEFISGPYGLYYQTGFGVFVFNGALDGQAMIAGDGGNDWVSIGTNNQMAVVIDNVERLLVNPTNSTFNTQVDVNSNLTVSGTGEFDTVDITTSLILDGSNLTGVTDITAMLDTAYATSISNLDQVVQLKKSAFDWTVQDPTNHTDIAPYWKPFANSGTVQKIQTQAYGCTGVCDVVMRYTTQGLNTYSNMAVGIAVQPTITTTTTFTNNVIGTNRFVGIRFRDLSSFSITNRVDVYGLFLKAD